MADDQPDMDTKYPPGVQTPDLTPTTRGSRTPAHKVMAILALADQGHSLTHIATELSMARPTVQAILDKRTHHEALATLEQAIPDAAKAWTRAIQKAADLGKHTPARDLLVSRGVIEPVPMAGSSQAQTNVAIKIVLGTENSPLPDIDVTPTKS